MLKPMAEKRKQHLIGNVQPDLTMQGDRLKLNQILYNLTDNAIKYTQENGHILLRAFERDGMAVIQVSDDGPGISEADRKRIFERFYRALGTRVAGNGLGLAIVARIVDIHRGRIQVLDGPEGKGTTFEIVLPNRR